MFLPHGVRAVVSPQGYNKIHREWVLNWLWVWLFTPRDLCCCCPADHHDTGINTTWVNEFQHHWATHILSCHLEAGDMLQVFAFTNILSPVDLFFFIVDFCGLCRWCNFLFQLPKALKPWFTSLFPQKRSSSFECVNCWIIWGHPYNFQSNLAITLPLPLSEWECMHIFSLCKTIYVNYNVYSYQEGNSENYPKKKSETNRSCSGMTPDNGFECRHIHLEPFQ